jgi:hypothetical protein
MFSCRAFMHIPNSQRGKLVAKSLICTSQILSKANLWPSPSSVPSSATPGSGRLIASCIAPPDISSTLATLCLTKGALFPLLRGLSSNPSCSLILPTLHHHLVHLLPFKSQHLLQPSHPRPPLRHLLSPAVDPSIQLGHRSMIMTHVTQSPLMGDALWSKPT